MLDIVYRLQFIETLYTFWSWIIYEPCITFCTGSLNIQLWWIQPPPTRHTVNRDHTSSDLIWTQLYNAKKKKITTTKITNPTRTRKWFSSLYLGIKSDYSWWSNPWTLFAHCMQSFIDTIVNTKITVLCSWKLREPISKPLVYWH